MKIQFDAVYYEPQTLEYPLGKQLRETFQSLPWIEIESHNRIPQLSMAANKDFPKLKQHLIIGIRKTHKYVENHKVSDWLVHICIRLPSHVPLLLSCMQLQQVLLLTLVRKPRANDGTTFEKGRRCSCTADI